MSYSQSLRTLLVALLACHTVHTYPTECSFPEHWRGTWFQSNVHQEISISDKEVSSKGNCTLASQQKYVVHNAVGRCYKCVIFYEKHVNVIQYKESFCNPDSKPPDLDFLCGHVNGDIQLYSMFRVNYHPIACPLRGPFSFSYSRGHMLQEECHQPNSRLERCIHSYRMLFRYQACVDVVASAEQSVEEMECLGMWKEGSARYLVTRRVSPNIARHEDAFRCFIYERAKPQEQPLLDYHLAESAEATCSGLFSTSDGSTRLSLRRAPAARSRCRLPLWASGHRRWHSLDRATSYQFNRNGTGLVVTGADQETHLECDRVVSEGARRALFVVRSTTGCMSGFQCMAFYRRDGHVMESQLGDVTRDAESACARHNFSRHKADYQTLVSSSQHHVVCPHLGQYSVTGQSHSARDPDDREGGDRDERALTPEFSALRVGCQSHDTIVLAGRVSDQSRAFSCHGSWQENDTFYLVASPRRHPWESTRHYCFVYSVADDNLRFSRVMRTCSRAVRPGVEGELTFNVTARAECLTSSARRWRPVLSPLLLSVAAAVLVRR
ncbi:uncharacterized protein LOC122390532 [Amphibalanus amphitrite]|uniref:uncharacterized protein LOC122390532 n=1 Tax=Amphibalanus amphitrite TaxID=1232801 RepID=UPI001C90E5EA|nr:uncharacterized protein LOC122390532 [Amphibalanus amphitrite]